VWVGRDRSRRRKGQWRGGQGSTFDRSFKAGLGSVTFFLLLVSVVTSGMGWEGHWRCVVEMSDRGGSGSNARGEVKWVSVVARQFG
jgi:hypothetical protein